MTVIHTALPATGFIRPDEAQLGKLFKIVSAAHPGFARTVELAAFSRAFVAVGYLWRLAEPSTKHSFAHRLDHVNETLTRFGEAAISGPALMCAVLAHGDIAWRQADPHAGQLLEVALDPYSGRRCSNTWRALLSGEANLLPPTPPPPLLQRQTEPSPVRIFKQRPDGEMRPVGPHESLWR